MSKQEIIDRILFDAESQADSIIAAANEKADKIIAEAEAYAKRESEAVKAECDAYARDVSEKKAAAARLESAKISLLEKRKTLDYVYAEALERLKSLPKEDVLALYGALLKKYADDGDVVSFANGFAYVAEIKALPVFTEKHLALADSSVDIVGGMLLVGKKADKDLSFSALIERDKDAHLSEIAAEIF
ncbi:MAG: hypothetical protein J6A46_00145 [Clostridia bacterium]|nr:hypothetical protein [Clostridia bacterium]